MKKFLVFLCVFLVGLSVCADEIMEIETNVNMKNYWEKTGKAQQKVLEVGEKIINANKLDKHISIQVVRNLNTINAYASFTDKTVYVYSGLLYYIDNDDELASVIAHEMGHCLDFYKSPTCIISVAFNPKSFEKSADLQGIDLMVKAGYNPLAAIIMQKKLSGEYSWATWLFFEHPSASPRMMDIRLCA